MSLEHRQTLTRGFASLLVVAFCLSASLGRADWPQFRGPSGDGHAPATKGLPLSWSETENVTWKTEIPHRGWSTPAVMDGSVWLTTATLEGNDFFVIRVEETSGAVRLNEKLFHAEKPEPLGNNVNGYATPSPALEQGRVYVHFGSYGTACLDTRTGKVLWQRADLPCRHYRGPSSSPILFEDLLILTFDGADLQYIVALDKATGKTRWKTDRSVPWNDENVPGQMARDGDLRKAHSTPLIARVGDGFQMLSAGAKASYGYDPRDGRELWQVRYTSWSAAPVPLFRNGLGYFVTGSGKTELWAVRVNGRGNVTDTQVAWKFGNQVAKTASPILVGALIYMVSDDGIVTCLNADTGEQVWRERIGGKYAASPVFAEGRLYFFSQEGNTTVLEPGASFKALGTNSLADGFMASPAVANDAFILRTKTHLYRIASKTRSGPTPAP